MTRKFVKGSGKIKATPVYSNVSLKPAKTKGRTITQLTDSLKRRLYPAIKIVDGQYCISCGKYMVVNTKDYQAGHYAKFELCNEVFKWYPINISSQCSYCNLHLRGNTINYRNALVRRYGNEKVDWMDSMFRRTLLISFDYRTWLIDSIAVTKGKPPVEIYNIMTERVEAVLSSLKPNE